MPKCWTCRYMMKKFAFTYYCPMQNILMVKNDLDADEPCIFYSKSPL